LLAASNSVFAFAGLIVPTTMDHLPYDASDRGATATRS